MARPFASLLPLSSIAFMLSVSASCADLTKDPERVSDRFVDLYFLELDLDGAAKLAEGPARTRVLRDLELAMRTRATTPVADAKPRVYYDKPTRQRGASDMLHSTYRLDIKIGDGEISREVVVMTAKRGDRWSVIGFREAEEGGSGGAGGIAVRTTTAAPEAVRTGSAAR